MSKHIVKNTHKDGKELDSPEYWCGRVNDGFQWYFLDTHHAALSVGGSQQPCKQCVKAIIKQFEREL